MLLHRTTFFLLVITLVLAPFVIFKMTWLLRSEKTTGVFVVESYESALDQIRSPYSLIRFNAGRDTIWLKGPSNLGIAEQTVVPVRYQRSDPEDATVDTFKGIWGNALIYAGVPVFFLLLVFAHPDVVPYGSKIKLVKEKPFIQIIHQDVPASSGEN